MNIDRVKALEKARNMIHEDAKRDSHIIKERMADRNSSQYYADQPMDAYSHDYHTSTPQAGGLETADPGVDKLFEAMDNRMSQFSQKINEQKNNTNINHSAPSKPSPFTNSRLPKEIIESFSKDWIDQGQLSNASVISNISLPQQPQQINEQAVAHQQTVEAKVDYELIKSIVESSCKKYMSALSKKMIAENTDNSIKAVQFNGKKFSFITKNGDLYEATMTYKGNIKEGK